MESPFLVSNFTMSENERHLDLISWEWERKRKGCLPSLADPTCLYGVGKRMEVFVLTQGLKEVEIFPGSEG